MTISKMVFDQPEIALRLRSAFPSALAMSVDAALKVIPSDKLNPSTGDIAPVTIDTEQLHIPSRIYSMEPISLTHDVLSDMITACLYTRHHNGFVREKYLEQLLSCSHTEPWIPPFILQLVGEYVVEIIELVLVHVQLLRPNSYMHFAAENPLFMEITQQRIFSYWDCYYRNQFAHFKDYPGFQVMDALGLWTSPVGRRLIKGRRVQ